MYERHPLEMERSVTCVRCNQMEKSSCMRNVKYKDLI